MGKSPIKRERKAEKMSHKCRICNESALPVISYGKMPLANAFLTKDQFAGEYFFELAVAHCPACKMFQLVEQPNPEMMFHGDYAFFSGTSKKMAAHFAAKAESHIKSFLNGKNNPFVVELGSNDGIFLKNFAVKSIRHLGIEPSGNVAAEACKNGVNSLVAFFGKDTAEKVRAEYGAADIISAANVMCHIPDLDSVGRGVDALLALDGIFEFEDPYLGAMIEKTSYDQIYDEHVYIFSAQAVANAFARHGLELFHVEPLQTHGGSMRYYLCRKGAHQVRGSVKEQLIWEEKLGLGRADTYKAFAGRCRQNREELVS
ncbi:MAG: methyltransferase domain-containing protein, partial [Proteobacteria bacterium]|nr:methyltransferase domain-containing protein [Pseudomonadota bacterium]